jgi:hypothetical protein
MLGLWNRLGSPRAAWGARHPLASPKRGAAGVYHTARPVLRAPTSVGPPEKRRCVGQWIRGFKKSGPCPLALTRAGPRAPASGSGRARRRTATRAPSRNIRRFVGHHQLRLGARTTDAAVSCCCPWATRRPTTVRAYARVTWRSAACATSSPRQRRTFQRFGRPDGLPPSIA